MNKPLTQISISTKTVKRDQYLINKSVSRSQRESGDSESQSEFEVFMLIIDSPDGHRSWLKGTLAPGCFFLNSL